MKVGVSLRDARGCSKPGCGHRAPLDRHHIRHQALWFGPWAHRGNEPHWRKFVNRYYEFRKDDTADLCRPHHAEIHSIYDAIIADDIAATGLPLYLYSWKQGKILMDKLELAFKAWILVETPGLDSELYERTKKLWRGLQKKKAKKAHPNVKRPKKKLKKKRRRRN